MSNLSYAFHQGFVMLAALAFWSCGGAMVDDGAGGTGSVGSGGVTGGAGAVGGTTSQSYPSVNVCYGVVASPSLPCVGLTDEYGPVEKDATECVFTVSIPAGYRLKPDFLKLYFDIDNSGRLEIPYVGTMAGCPTTGTVGGWYATNVTGGSSTIGLCGCTCQAAKLYPVTLNVDCAGVGL